MQSLKPRKHLVLVVCALLAGTVSFASQAHELRHNRVSGHISIAGPSYYSPFPSASLIGGITYRNYQSLHNRVINSRPSVSRAYQNGYRDGFRDGHRSAERHDDCYEVYYDRSGHQVRRQLPPSACQH